MREHFRDTPEVSVQRCAKCDGRGTVLETCFDHGYDQVPCDGCCRYCQKPFTADDEPITLYSYGVYEPVGYAHRDCWEGGEGDPFVRAVDDDEVDV
jgi:hypothetical protein